MPPPAWLLCLGLRWYRSGMKHVGGRSQIGAERAISDKSLDFVAKRNRFVMGLSSSIELFRVRSMLVKGESKGYRSRVSQTGAPTRIVLARKEREMIRMIADCASPQFIAQQLDLGEIQLGRVSILFLLSWRCRVGSNCCPVKHGSGK